MPLAFRPAAGDSASRLVDMPIPGTAGRRLNKMLGD
jgi:hypothetical protein